MVDGRSLTILHVSDLQFGRHHVFAGTGLTPADQHYDSLFARLHEDLDRLCEDEGLRPELIVVSGDLAEWGMPSEFEHARRFLEHLTQHLRLEQRNVVVVPGNHDVNREACAAYFAQCRADETEPRPPYRAKWKHFAAMLNQFYRNQPVQFEVDEPWGLVEFAERRVVVAALNSTMAESHRDDDHYGWLGEAQLRWFAERLRERRDWMRIGVVHHNVLRGAVNDDESLRDADDLERLLAPHLDLLLHGHMHNAGQHVLSSGLRVLSTGSAALEHAARPIDVPNQYQVLQITHERIMRWARRYEPDQRRWSGDTRISDDGADWRSVIGVPTDSGEHTAPYHHVRALRTESEARRDDLLARVADVCRLRQPGAQVTRVSSRGVEYLRVTELTDLAARLHPVGTCEGGVTRQDLERFASEVHDRYREADPQVTSELVYSGDRADDEVVELARQRGIRLVSFLEYQGVLDLRGYVARLNARLRADPLYPWQLYVSQRYSLLDHSDAVEYDLAGAALEWLGAWQSRFVLVLGDFGTGKSFLLRELARRIPTELPALVPVLIELGALQKARTVDELVAAHLVAAGEDSLNLGAFRYLLREGRIVLLFDGYDELATRVTYERAAEHFQTLLDAAEGKAKVVVTSRTQHFLNEHQVRTALGSRVDQLPGRRLVQLKELNDGQIREFLVKAYADEEKADRLLRLIRDIRDLPELSRNPRMLSFIAALDEERLKEVRERRGAISAAALYKLLLAQWLEHEHGRVHPRGGAPSLSVEDRWRAATRLALELWPSAEAKLALSDMTAAVAAALDQLPAYRMEVEEAAHAVGSGTLLVRDEEGAFSFVHRSVMEWLVANYAAEALIRGEQPDVLHQREASQLMAEFFCDLAGREAAVDWARQVLSKEFSVGAAKANALLILSRLDEQPAVRRAMLAREVLRGTDLSERDLTGADLRHADLRECLLVGTSLFEAELRDANLQGARLDRADLRSADLRGADFSGARLLGADLRGAKMDGSKWRRTALIGAQMDPGALAKVDTWGAAGPGGRVQRLTSGGRRPQGCVTVSPDGKVIVTGGADGAVRVWESRTGGLQRIIGGHSGPVHASLFNADGSWFATAGYDRAIKLWDSASGHLLRVLEGHAGAVYTIAISADGGLLLAAGSDREIHAWDPASGELLASVRGVTEAVRSMALSPDGQWLATGGDDRRVAVWDMESRKCRCVLEGHTDSVRTVAVSPDGRWLASAGYDRVVRVWEPTGGRMLHAMEGHADWVRSVAISTDGQWLVSGGNDRAVRVWEAATGRSMSVHDGHTGVTAVAISPSGRWLAATGDDGTIRLWNPHSGEALATLVPLSEGWACLLADGRYKLEGVASGEFWYTAGLCRFEVQELDPYVPEIRRVPADIQILPD